MLKKKYLILTDGKNPASLKWIKELEKVYDVYLFQLHGSNQKVENYLPKDRIFTKKNPFDIKNIFFLCRLIKKISPDVVHAHYASSYGITGWLASLLSRRDFLFIVSTWGSDILLFPKKSPLHKFLIKKTLRSADLVTSVSYNMTDEIEILAPNKKILTFPFGVNSDQYLQALPYKENIIFSNRAINKIYNIDKVVEWFLSQDKKFRLVIANVGTELDRIHSLVRQMNLQDRVEFVGVLDYDELNEWYRRSKYFISIPSSDGTPVSVLEAIAAGCIPIVSNIPANRILVFNNYNGFYFYEGFNIPDCTDEMSIRNISITASKLSFQDNVTGYIDFIENFSERKL